MKKNGFTLVELLAVIVLLGLIIVIVMTNGFGVLNKAKGGINQIEEDNLIEAAKVFLVDVDNDFVNSYPNGCGSKESFTDADGCDVLVSYLKDNYLDKEVKSCDGDLFLNLKIEETKDAAGEVIDTNYYVTKPIDVDGNEIVICSN